MPMLSVRPAGNKVVMSEHAVYVNSKGTSVTEMYPNQAREVARQLLLAADAADVAEGEELPCHSQ